jgi:hypothetical protein
LLKSWSMNTKLIALAMGVAAVTACRMNSLVSPREGVTQRGIYNRPSSGIDARAGVIILDQPSWEAAWQVVVANYAPGEKPPLPVVDFDTHVVLLAAGGVTTTQLLSFRIADVRVGPEGLAVSVDVVSPECGSLPVITTPVDIVSVPRLETRAQFTFVDRTAEC